MSIVDSSCLTWIYGWFRCSWSPYSLPLFSKAHYSAKREVDFPLLDFLLIAVWWASRIGLLPGRASIPSKYGKLWYLKALNPGWDFGIFIEHVSFKLKHCIPDLLHLNRARGSLVLWLSRFHWPRPFLMLPRAHMWDCTSSWAWASI